MINLAHLIINVFWTNHLKKQDYSIFYCFCLKIYYKHTLVYILFVYILFLLPIIFLRIQQ